MKALPLLEFNVKDFRAIDNCGWIATNEITSLIGTSESGKSNLPLALWKFKPASDGAIDLLSDAPRKSHNEIRASEERPSFISARFKVTSELQRKIEKLSEVQADYSIVEVARDFDGEYFVTFPNSGLSEFADSEKLGQLLTIVGEHRGIWARNGPDGSYRVLGGRRAQI